jgi:hypothetical protein
MMGLRFLDFDLMFQRTANGYRAQVLSSPAGQASIEFLLPFSDLEIENFLLRMGRPRQPVRRLGTSQIEAARAFGGRLFEAAFNGEVRSCLRGSLDEAHRLDQGLRIRLRLADAPELNDLPWEYLLNPALDRFLALSAETPLVRYLDLPERIRPLAVKPPLEVLTIISSPTDCASLDVEAEWRKLQESLAELQERGLIILSRLESPTLPHLQRWLRRKTCHILHFIGHGGFNFNIDDGLLQFTDEKGRSREVTGQTLGTLLHDHRPLRLAVLNACEGARASRTDPFAGVAQSLIRQGIPAVVAMQFEISDKAAITFAYELFAAVVDGYPVDAALAEARKALFFAGHELEWGTPVLYMRSPDGRIFDFEVAAVPAAVMKVKEELFAAKPESRPTPGEVQPAPAALKEPWPTTGAKAPLVEPALAATVATLKEEPIVAKPVPIKSRPEPADVKPAPATPEALSPESAAIAPPALSPKVPSGETISTAVPKEIPAQTKTPAVRPKPAEAKISKAMPLAGGRLQRASPMLGWIGLLTLLGFSVFTSIHLLSGDGKSEDRVPAPARPQQVNQVPVMEREAGVYLKTQVRTGEKFTKTAMTVVEGKSLALDEPRTLNDVIGFCATTDLDRDQKLSWKNLASCP